MIERLSPLVAAAAPSEPGAPIALALGAAVIVLLATWRGWRLGIVRQALSIVAVGAAYVAGYFGGGLLVPLLRPLALPDRFLAAVGAVAVGLGVYTVLALAGALVLKRTAQQSVGIVRLAFGATGAVLGAAFGLALVLILAIGLRLLGTLAEPAARRAGEHPASGMALWMASARHTLSTGAIGSTVDRLDPIPRGTYDTLKAAGEIASNLDSLERFISDPAVKRSGSRSKLQALRDDPEIVKLMREGRIWSLLQHPKVIAVANDASVLEVLEHFGVKFSRKGSAKSAEVRTESDTP